MVYLRRVFRTNLMPSQDSCSLYWYHIIVDQQLAWSLPYTYSLISAQNASPTTQSLWRFNLRVQCPLRNTISNLRLFLQTLLQTLDLLRSKSLNSSLTCLDFPISFQNVHLLSSSAFFISHWRSYIPSYRKIQAKQEVISSLSSPVHLVFHSPRSSHDLVPLDWWLCTLSLG